MTDSKHATEHKTVIELGEEEIKKAATKFIKLNHHKWYRILLHVLFILLAVISVIVSVTLIIVTVLSSIATKAYDAELTNRVAAMLLLAVTAALTICMVIYGVTSVFKSLWKAVEATAAILFILAIVQGLVAGLSIRVDKNMEGTLLRSLSESFRQAKDDNNSRHSKIWAMTQSDLQCCGLYGPNDYRSPANFYFLAPDVPISCCPTYTPSRSDLVQERERMVCKASAKYFSHGCRDKVVMEFKSAASLVLIVTFSLVVLEVLLLIIGALEARFIKLDEHSKHHGTKKDTHHHSHKHHQILCGLFGSKNCPR